MKKLLYLLALAGTFAASALFAQPALNKTCHPAANPVAPYLPAQKTGKFTFVSIQDIRPLMAKGTDNAPLPPAENRVDQIEFYHEKGITLPGGTVADLINQAYCFNLDLTAYDQLPGTATIQVFINQELTPIKAATVTYALKKIPAEQIKAIKIISGPAQNPAGESGADIVIQVTSIK